MALTWHSPGTHLLLLALSMHSLWPNGTLSPITTNKKNVPEHMLKESVLSMAPARSVRTPSDHKNAVSPTQGHSSHFSKSCPRCCKIEEGVPKSCGSKLLWMAEMDMGGHGETFWRHLWDTWEVSALCPQNVPKMSPLCPPCVPNCLQNGTHLALTWHSLAAPGTQYALTLT